MIDEKKVYNLIEERLKFDCNDEYHTEEYWSNLVSVLGDDKDEVVNFLKTTDDDTFEMLDEIYEELSGKFGEDIDDIFCNPNKYRNIQGA